MVMTNSPSETCSIPLSPVQQGMYFHHLHKKNRVYLQQMLCDIDGSLDVELVEHSLNRLIEAHECLRTVFRNDDHRGPRQVVLPYRSRPLRYQDLSDLPDPEGALAQHAAREMDRNLDLSVETSRCELVKVGRDRHVFLWTYHHLIADGWTCRLFQDQFCATYLAAWRHGDEPELPRVPYRRYVEWIDSQDARKAGAYWTRYLQDRAGPSDAALPAADAYENKVTVVVELRSSTRELLGALARRHRSTVNHIVLAAWGTYVLEHFQKSAAIFGCVVSGRMIRLQDIDKMGGVFVNAIPICVHETDTVATTIAEVRRHMMASAEYAYMSLSDIMAYGNTTPSSVLSVVNFQIDHVELNHGPARSLPFRVRNIRHNEQAHYDVYLDVYTTKSNLKLAIHHDSRKHDFDPKSVQVALDRILDQFDVNAKAALGDVGLRAAGHVLPIDGALHFGES